MTAPLEPGQGGQRPSRLLGLAWLIRLTPEWILAALVVLAFGDAVYHFVTQGFLRQPFLFIQDDTLMDWFNPGFWAWRPGAYDVWRSVYPPLSFVVLKMTTLQSCYVDSPITARDCDWYAKIWIIAIYVIGVAFAAKAFLAMDRRTAWVRAGCFAIGMPMLFTLERGNLMLMALPFFILANGPLKAPHWLQALSTAITINYKPYLAVSALALGIRRQWRLAEFGAILTVLVYCLTLAIMGEGTIGQIQANTTAFLTMAYEQAFGQMYYSTSYAPLLVLEKSGFPLKIFIGSRTIDLVSDGVPMLILSSLAIAGIAAAITWLQPKAVTGTRLATILLSAYLVYQSPGGYAFIFITYLVFLEKWGRIGPAIALVCAYLLLINWDYIVAPVGRLDREAWLTGLNVSNSFGVSIGQFVRPALCIIILWALAIDTILQVIKAHRTDRPVLGLVIPPITAKA